MIYLVLCILINAGLILVFRIFPTYGIRSFQAIVANYFVAGTLGFLMSGMHPIRTETLHAPWLPFVFLLGLLFISLFYLIALTTQKLGVSVASVSNKMSVVIPVVSSILLYNDRLSSYQWVGLAGALAAVAMVSIKERDERFEKETGLTRILPLILFFGCGLLDTLVSYLQLKFSSHELPSEFLLSCGFLIAGIMGICAFMTGIIRGTDSWHTKSFIAGLLLGIPNFFSMFLIMKTLESGLMNASVFFPVNNIGVVSTATLLSVVYFRERLSKMNVAGILLSILSIILIALGGSN